jgi:uncharacterized protein (TIGR00255 family)
MTHSMTAYASRTGALDAISWQWEMRGVNARGLDLRLRLPDGIDGLEAHVRGMTTKGLSRGNVTINLRLNMDESQQALALDETQLDRVLTALDTVQERAFAMGVTLGQPTAADVLNTRGVVMANRSDGASAALIAALKDDFEVVLQDFVAMRASEGDALGQVIAGQLSQVADLTGQAAVAAEARRADTQAALTVSLRRVMEDIAEIDEARVAQELALLAVKADIVEEIDRLRTHVSAAQALLTDDKPTGRKLDFLCQEFNREANTLCSKAGAAALTTIGLDLKAVIDQMREQIQNVE